MTKKKESEFNILPFIPAGHRNAVTRSELRRRTGKNDRYFIPDENDPEDMRLLRLFVIQEEHRLKSIGWSLKGARRAAKRE